MITGDSRLDFKAFIQTRFAQDTEFLANFNEAWENVELRKAYTIFDQFIASCGHELSSEETEIDRAFYGDYVS